MSREVVISRRFRGPPSSVNGGYASGVIADGLKGTVTVTLRVPPPLDKKMTLSGDGESSRLTDGETLIGEAKQATMNLDVPEPPTLDIAVEASRSYIGFENPVFPFCFVCGPEREAGEGLRIFAGAVAGTDVVASPWIPGEALRAGVGEIDRRFVWAVLDCPSYYALPGAPIALLGRQTAQIDRLPEIDEQLVVIGWPHGTDGRKLFSGAALSTADGEVIARSDATWIEVDELPV